MTSFHHLPLSIHLKLADYLNVQDKISASQSFRAIRPLYKTASFWNSYITVSDNPQARSLVKTGDLRYSLRAVPFAAFQNPDKYSWFEPGAIELMVIGADTDSKFQLVIDTAVEYSAKYHRIKRVEFDFTLSGVEIERAIAPLNANFFHANFSFPAHYDHFAPSSDKFIPFHIVESVFASLSQRSRYNHNGHQLDSLKLFVLRKLELSYFEDLIALMSDPNIFKNLKLFITRFWVQFSQDSVLIDPTFIAYTRITRKLERHIELYTIPLQQRNNGVKLDTVVRLPYVTSFSFNAKVSEGLQGKNISHSPKDVGRLFDYIDLPSLTSIEDHRILFLDKLPFTASILSNITKLMFKTIEDHGLVYKHLPRTFKALKSLKVLHFEVKSQSLISGCKYVHQWSKIIKSIFDKYLSKQPITTEHISQLVNEKFSSKIEITTDLVEWIKYPIFNPLSVDCLDVDMTKIPQVIQEVVNEFRLYEFIFLHLVLLPKLDYLSLDYLSDSYPSLQLYYVLLELKNIKQIFINVQNNNWETAPDPWLVTTLPFKEMILVEKFNRHFPRDSGQCAYVVDLEHHRKYAPSLATAALNNIPEGEFVMRRPRVWSRSAIWDTTFHPSMVQEFTGWL